MTRDQIQIILQNERVDKVCLYMARDMRVKYTTTRQQHVTEVLTTRDTRVQ